MSVGQDIDRLNALLAAFLDAKADHTAKHKAAETSRLDLKASHTKVIEARAALMAVIDEDPAKETK